MPEQGCFKLDGLQFVLLIEAARQRGAGRHDGGFLVVRLRQVLDGLRVLYRAALAEGQGFHLGLSAVRGLDPGPGGVPISGVRCLLDGGFLLDIPDTIRQPCVQAVQHRGFLVRVFGRGGGPAILALRGQRDFLAGLRQFAGRTGLGLHRRQGVPAGPD